MGIDDIYDGIDIFSDTQETENEIDLSEWVFPIIGRKCSGDDYHENGTGFFVNDNGYFITAGHVLKNKDLLFNAQIDGQQIEFEIIYFEHISKNDQRPPICRDFAICRMNFQSKNFCKFSINPLRDKKLMISGCTRNPLQKCTINPIMNGEFYVNIIDGIDEKLNSSRELSGNGFDYRPICENTRSLKLPRGIRYNGLSGGPVYFENIIYGLFIGIEYIQSEYIIEKLKQFKIPFNS